MYRDGERMSYQHLEDQWYTEPEPVEIREWCNECGKVTDGEVVDQCVYDCYVCDTQTEINPL